MISAEERAHLEAPELAPVKEFMAGAFREAATKSASAASSSFQYGHILQQLEQRDDPEMLWRIYICLADFVVQIAHRPDAHKQLLNNLFSFDWNAGDNIIVAYMHLLGLLVSANPSLLSPIAKHIVRNLLAEGPSSPSRHSRLHGTLKSLMSLSPGGQTGLFSTLAEMFPYKLEGRGALVAYVNELLAMCQYLPHFQQRILDLVIAKCLEIDVDILTEESAGAHGADVSPPQLEAEDMFHFDQDGAETEGRRDGYSHGRRIAADASELADSLDGMLASLVAFVDAQFGRKDGSVAERLFLQLLGVFERRVLTIRRSKFVQFIMFYMSSKRPEFAETFCRRLLDIFRQTKNAASQRNCAVMYLASFYSRSKACSAVTIRDGVVELIRWCGAYCEAHRGDAVTDLLLEVRDRSKTLFVAGKGGSASLKHESLYLTVQAICYTLCFYGDDLWVHLLSVEGALLSEFFTVMTLFQPLWFSRDTVRIEFLHLVRRTAGVANAAGVSLFEDDMFSAPGDLGAAGDRGMDLVQSAGERSGSPAEGATYDALLEYIRPFDPCLLQATGRFVSSGYQNMYSEAGSDTAGKFDYIATAVPSRPHAESEDEKSSGTSLMQWPSTFPAEVPRQPEEALDSMGGAPNLDGNAGADADVGEWTPAPVSRSRRRNRRKIVESEEAADIVTSDQNNSNMQDSRVSEFEVPQGALPKRDLFTPGITPFRSMLPDPSRLAGSGAGIVPSFDSFGLSSAHGEKSRLVHNESADASKPGGGKHFPALNDFQKRAREYSVGSVGSW